MTNRPIVVGYDDSAGAQSAVRWALIEAEHTGAAVRLAYAYEAPLLGGAVLAGPGPYVWTDMRADAEQRIAEVVREVAAEHPTVPVTGHLLEGPAGPALVSESAGAGLLVLGSRGHGGFTGLLLGSVTVAVTTHAHCPVIVVHGTPMLTDPEAPVVVGLDGSTTSELAAGYAFATAARRGVPLVAARAWLPPAPPMGAYPRSAVSEPEELEQAERDLLNQWIAPWRGKFPDVSIQARVILAGAASALIELSARAQLVVVGTRGRGGLRGLLLGSVSQQLLHHATCPVAIVRELSAP